MTVVSDASPLILLAKIGRLELLGLLYDEVVVPRAVMAEVEAKSSHDARVIDEWSRRQDVLLRDPGESILARLPEKLFGE